MRISQYGWKRIVNLKKKYNILFCQISKKTSTGRQHPLLKAIGVKNLDKVPEYRTHPKQPKWWPQS
jgi:hypothetical protein